MSARPLMESIQEHYDQLAFVQPAHPRSSNWLTCLLPGVVRFSSRSRHHTYRKVLHFHYSRSYKGFMNKYHLLDNRLH